MSQPPARPMIYHITHVDNLPRIIADGMLHCDAEMLDRGGPPAAIGLSEIKKNRLGLPVKCHPGDMVGDYVPFYFCSRSIMLYLFYMNNSPKLTYRGGQEPIVHLEADLNRVVAWADANERRWAFSLANAGASYTEFRCDLRDLQDIDWDAVAARDWRAADIRERKQAEFLVHRSFPWRLISRIGARTPAIKARVDAALGDSAKTVPTETRLDWYY